MVLGTILRSDGTPRKSVEQPVAAGPLAALNELALVPDQPLRFQLGDGGMDPGAGSLQVRSDGLLAYPNPTLAVGVGRHVGVNGFGGNGEPGPAHYKRGDGSPAAAR
jgi:hypothetical protein